MINWPSQELELRAEIDRLRMEVSVRGNMNEGLRADNDRLRAENVRLQKRVDAYEQSRKRPPGDFELQGF